MTLDFGPQLILFCRQVTFVQACSVLDVGGGCGRSSGGDAGGDAGGEVAGGRRVRAWEWGTPELTNNGPGKPRYNPQIIEYHLRYSLVG